MRNSGISAASFLFVAVAQQEPGFDWKPQDPMPSHQTAQATSAPQTTPSKEFWKEGSQSFSGSFGFTDGPDSFLVGLEYSSFLQDRLAVGPLVQLGFDDDFFLFAPTLNFKYYLDVPEPKLFPFLHAGAGFAYISEDNRPGDDDELGFLFNFGAGADYRLSDRVYLGSNLIFNVMPNEVLGENFFFSWQVVGISFRF